MKIGQVLLVLAVVGTGVATSTSAWRCGASFKEFVTRHVSSARTSKRFPWSMFAPGGTRSRARISIADCVTRSTRSTNPRFSYGAIHKGAPH
jgi:hypothetical protein